MCHTFFKTSTPSSHGIRTLVSSTGQSATTYTTVAVTYTTVAFAVRQVCEKYLANGKDVFWSLMDLEKTYDTIDWKRHMWQMLRVYGVGGKLLKEVQSFYADSRTCVRMGD